ncbi:MAG: MBL fold metallo-hydrolase [Coriobacteriales bacterium]|jgi:L-ascorbate metabolism protein UlaG (beta-lactamase superfamily)|nr:MBL fold metallo-hydrolase [Coriobacteriales bacterium]
MPKLLFQGHGSLRLTADDGRVIFIDPNAGKGYESPADIILVTHQHSDHNKIRLCTQKPDCQIITNVEALAGGTHNSFDVNGILIQAVRAANRNHDPEKCVGFIVTIDGVKIYFSGDTSKTPQMESFAELALDYALFCGDGLFNMGPKEAAECARMVGARHNSLIHLGPGFISRMRNNSFDAPNKLNLIAGDEIDLHIS